MNTNRIEADLVEYLYYTGQIDAGMLDAAYRKMHGDYLTPAQEKMIKALNDTRFRFECDSCNVAVPEEDIASVIGCTVPRCPRCQAIRAGEPCSIAQQV